jgi:hypothetical protein
MVELGRCARLAVDGVGHGIVEIPAHESVDSMIERRREEQALAALRRLVEQSLHRGEEPEVGHEIGFVDDVPRRGRGGSGAGG